MQYSFRLA